MIKKILSVVLTVAMALMLASCGGKTLSEVIDEKEIIIDTQAQNAEGLTEENAKEATTSRFPAKVSLADPDILSGKQVGFSISKATDDEWSRQLVTAIEELGEYYGASVECDDANMDEETQVRDIEKMIADEYDVIFVDAVSASGPCNAIDEAGEEGIPVITCYDECDSDVETHVTWDAYEGGKVFAEYFINYVKEHNGDDKVKVVELTNSASVRAAERYKALHEAIEADSEVNIEIVDSLETEGQRENAYLGIESEKKAFDYVISDVDNGAQGAVAALHALGTSDAKVFSMSAYGAEPFTALHSNDEYYVAFLDVDPWVLASIMYRCAINSIFGKENAAVTYIDSYIVDGSNVEDFWTFD